ncbi:MAG TPA: phosphatase PAP2 family protein [Flavobacterium sp.]|nr:phosphatase PAP2 family protein [Flavobacterium sp.]
MKKLQALLLTSCVSLIGYSQQPLDSLFVSNDSLLVQQDSLVIKNRGFTSKQLILPASLIAGGFLLRNSSTNARINRDIKEFRDDNFSAFRTNVDDYFQYSTILLTFGGNAMGFKSKNNYKQMISDGIVSNILLSAIVLPLKNNIGDMRPDGSASNSFPSGHTTAAFNCATLHFLEYRDDNVLFASAGFGIASTTALFRVLNNRHWLSDVTAAAGIGIATAVVVHYFNPFRFESKKETSLTLLPTYSQNTAGFVLNYRFK